MKNHTFIGEGFIDAVNAGGEMAFSAILMFPVWAFETLLRIAIFLLTGEYINQPGGGVG